MHSLISLVIMVISPILAQHLALGVVLQDIPTDPLLKPARVPLDGNPSLMGWLGVLSQLNDGVLNPTAYLIIKDIKPLSYEKCHIENPLPEGHHLSVIAFGH